MKKSVLGLCAMFLAVSSVSFATGTNAPTLLYTGPGGPAPSKAPLNSSNAPSAPASIKASSPAATQKGLAKLSKPAPVKSTQQLQSALKAAQAKLAADKKNPKTTPAQLKADQGNVSSLQQSVHKSQVQGSNITH